MKDRITEIKNGILEYCRENLNEEYKNKSLDLLETIQQKNEEILETSRVDIWVAAILNIILEDAEMFKRKHPLYITKKDFSQKTGVSSKTIKAKAEALRELLNNEGNVEEEVAVSSQEEVEVKEEAKVEVVAEEQTEEISEEKKQELREQELKEARYKAFMGLAHEDLPFEDKLKYLKQAMEAAKEMIVDEENTTNYWDNETSRPYMVAAQDLATLLTKNNNYKEAIEMLELLLEMDSNDNQGNRFKLLNILIKKNDRKRVNELFTRFKDEQSAMWDYFKALYYFKNGSLYLAKESIKSGVDKNKYIGLLLMQWSSALRMSGSLVDPVLYTEATYYFNENFKLWKDTKGSLKWLVSAVIK